MTAAKHTSYVFILQYQHSHNRKALGRKQFSVWIDTTFEEKLMVLKLATSEIIL